MGAQDGSLLRWYYHTPHWRKTRIAKLDSTKEQCEKCGREARTVFHRTFATLGREKLDDLIVLCNPCRTW